MACRARSAAVQRLTAVPGFLHRNIVCVVVHGDLTIKRSSGSTTWAGAKGSDLKDHRLGARRFETPTACHHLRRRPAGSGSAAQRAVLLLVTACVSGRSSLGIDVMAVCARTIVYKHLQQKYRFVSPLALSMPRPFCPVTRHRDCSSDCGRCRSSRRLVPRRPSRARRRSRIIRACSLAGCGSAPPSHRGCDKVPGRVRAAAVRAEARGRSAAVASGLCWSRAWRRVAALYRAQQ